MPPLCWSAVPARVRCTACIQHTTGSMQAGRTRGGSAHSSEQTTAQHSGDTTSNTSNIIATDRQLITTSVVSLPGGCLHVYQSEQRATAWNNAGCASAVGRQAAEGCAGSCECPSNIERAAHLSSSSSRRLLLVASKHSALVAHSNSTTARGEAAREADRPVGVLVRAARGGAQV